MNITNIDWADRTWNPVTGCFHNCPYCYAKRIAERFKPKYKVNEESYASLANMQQDDFPVVEGDKGCPPFPYGFIPTFYYGRLDEPQRIKKPQNVFVCSMADLFGDWVPDEWIQRVFEACEKAPQHRYIFLTKNPKRYEKFHGHITENMFVGITITKQSQIDRPFHRRTPNGKTFLSIEPIQERINLSYSIDWVIIGAETGNRKGKVIPKREWIESLINQCRKRNISIFIKNSLADIWGEPLIQEFPWETKKSEIGAA